MAKMTIRSTYALDQQTAQNIRQLAKNWNVSQAEVIRRSVREAAEAHREEAPTPGDVIAHYRNSRLPRSREESARLVRSMHELRHEDDEQRSKKLDG